MATWKPSRPGQPGFDTKAWQASGPLKSQRSNVKPRNANPTGGHSGRGGGTRSFGGPRDGAATDAQGNPLVDALLGMLGTGGSPGSAARYSPGYNGAPARAAARSSYDQQLGNTKKVYGQIGTEIKGRAPAIQAGYDQATAAINADAAKRTTADATRNTEADQRNMETAAALGLTTVAPTDTRADRIREAGSNAYNSNAQSWKGFNDASVKTALERNTSTKDAFAYAGTQSQQQLAVLLQQALDSIAGQEAANPGRWVGGSSGSSSAKSDLSILKTLMGYDMDQQQLAQKAAGSAPKPGKFDGVSTATWRNMANTASGVSSLGLGGAQMNSLIMKGISGGNPQDFARVYAALYG